MNLALYLAAENEKNDDSRNHITSSRKTADKLF